jgi:hypothetical protein
MVLLNFSIIFIRIKYKLISLNLKKLLEMKKAAFILLFTMGFTITYAQDIDDIKDEMGQDIMKAKTMIDKYLSNPKNQSKPEGWYYKGVIYNTISKKDSLRSACTDCKLEAFEAFKKYKELDPKDVLMILEQNGSLFDIYNGYFDLGAKSFNNKNYSSAFYDFKNALVIEDYINSKSLEYNGFKFPTLDTALILNTALSARAANDDSDAVVYYKKLSDANLSASQYLEAYEFPVDYYRKRKDSANLAIALDKGKKIFPTDEYWTGVEVDDIESGGGSKEDILKKYAVVTVNDPANYALNYNYAVDLYNYVYANDDKTANTSAYKYKIGDQIKKAIGINPTPEANLLMARYLYNSGFDYLDAAQKVKGAKPDDVKKRKELNDSSSAQMDAAIPYAETVADKYKGSTTLKPVEKGNYRQALSILQSVYQVKKDTAKADEYDKELKAVQ